MSKWEIMKPINNRKARFHYAILEELEAGIVLEGREVKSIKTGHLDISAAYVSFKGEEAYLINASIPLYQFAAPDESYEPTRERKLLLKKQEIASLGGKLGQKGLTLIPLKVYTVRGRIKVKLGVAKGKGEIDKRQTIKEREVKRKIKSVLRQKLN